MPDNGDNIINGLDLDWNAGGNFYEFNLSSDRPYLIMDDGLGGVHINGGNHTLYGSGSVGLYLNDTNYGIWFRDLTINGAFDYGVLGQNLHGAISYDVNVANARITGMDLQGNDMTIAYSDIAHLGSDASPYRTAGLALLGSNIDVYGLIAYDLRSAYESYAVGFNSTSGTGNTLSHSTLNGTEATGWSFDVWNSNVGDVTISNVLSYGWVHSGGTGNGSFNNYFASSLYNFGHGDRSTFDSTTTIVESDHTLTSYVGGSGRDVFIGDSSDQSFHAHGNDVIESGGGSDTFHFTTYSSGAITTLIDFDSGVDQIVLDVPAGTTFQAHGTSALGSGPVVVQNTYTDTFYFDPDGSGSAAWTPFLYIPSATLSSSDFLFT